MVSFHKDAGIHRDEIIDGAFSFKTDQCASSKITYGCILPGLELAVALSPLNSQQDLLTSQWQAETIQIQDYPQQLRKWQSRNKTMHKICIDLAGLASLA